MPVGLLHVNSSYNPPWGLSAAIFCPVP